MSSSLEEKYINCSLLLARALGIILRMKIVCKRDLPKAILKDIKKLTEETEEYVGKNKLEGKSD
jgi:hypothetical protein